MIRTLSSTAQAEINRGQIATNYVWLISIDHDDLGSPIRICGNTDDVVSDGDTYTAFELAIPVPQERSEELPLVSLILTNVNNSTVLSPLRQLSHQTVDRALVTTSIVRADSPDTVEVGPFEFELLSLTARGTRTELSLSYQHQLTANNWPSYKVVPARFPSAF